MISWLFYDCDGLLFDSESAAYNAWNEIYGSYGVSLPLHKWVECVGASEALFDAARYLTEISQCEESRDALIQRKNEKKSLLCDVCPPLPGVTSSLLWAQSMGLKCAVVSSSDRRWVHGHLKRLGLQDFFSFSVTKDDVQRVKPYPDLYEKALQKASLSPEEALVFEDAVNGIEAATRAGLATCAVPNPITKGSDFKKATYRIPSLLEAPSLILGHVTRRGPT